MADIVHLGSFGKTAISPVTDTADSFTNPGPYTSFYVQANRAIHLSVNGDATTDDVKIIASDTDSGGAYVYVIKGGELSFVLADGETDGEVRITEVAN